MLNESNGGEYESDSESGQNCGILVSHSIDPRLLRSSLCPEQADGVWEPHSYRPQYRRLRDIISLGHLRRPHKSSNVRLCCALAVPPAEGSEPMAGIAHAAIASGIDPN